MGSFQHMADAHLTTWNPGNPAWRGHGKCVRGLPLKYELAPFVIVPYFHPILILASAHFLGITMHLPSQASSLTISVLQTFCSLLQTISHAHSRGPIPLIKASLLSPILQTEGMTLREGIPEFRLCSPVECSPKCKQLGRHRGDILGMLAFFFPSSHMTWSHPT